MSGHDRQGRSWHSNKELRATHKETPLSDLRYYYDLFPEEWERIRTELMTSQSSTDNDENTTDVKSGGQST